MQTVTIDIIDDKAIELLNELEALHLIHVRQEDEPNAWSINKIAKLKGAMTKQPLDEVEKQLKELRDSWE